MITRLSLDACWPHVVTRRLESSPVTFVRVKCQPVTHGLGSDGRVRRDLQSTLSHAADMDALNWQWHTMQLAHRQLRLQALAGRWFQSRLFERYWWKWSLHRSWHGTNWDFLSCVGDTDSSTSYSRPPVKSPARSEDQRGIVEDRISNTCSIMKLIDHSALIDSSESTNPITIWEMWKNLGYGNCSDHMIVDVRVPLRLMALKQYMTFSRFFSKICSIGVV